MVRVEQYTSGNYETLAAASYNGVGHRTCLTMWVSGSSFTTTYVTDIGEGERVLAAATISDTRYYLYGQGLIAEYEDAWVYDHYWETPEQIEEYAEAVLGPREGEGFRSPRPK